MNIIIDLEHTISNSSHRISMKKNGIDRENFQLEFKNDRPNNNVIMFIEQLRRTGSFVVILSAKKEKYRELVEKWLRFHGVEYDNLSMKPDKLDLNSEDFKEQFIKGCSQKFDFALDDVGKNCEMFSRNNIPCLRIVQK